MQDDLEKTVVKPIARKMGGRMEVEDFEQELRIAVWKATKTYDPSRGASLRTWCWTAGMDRFRQMLVFHKRGKRVGQSVSFDGPLDGSESATLHDVIGGEDSRTREGLRFDVSRLPECYLEPIRLIREGYSFTETGAKLGCSYQAVQHRLEKAAVEIENPRRCDVCKQLVDSLKRRSKFCGKCRALGPSGRARLKKALV